MPRAAEVKKTKDVVHGYTSIHADIFDAIIDTPLFQRLRLILQNSYANRVYPGLSHTRFEHSLGVAHAMRKAVEEMSKNTRDLIPGIASYTVNKLMPQVLIRSIDEQKLRECIERALERIINELYSEETLLTATLTGLLHDVGHVMYSHTGEEALTHAFRTYLSRHLSHGLNMHEMLTCIFSEFLAARISGKNDSGEKLSTLRNALQRAASILKLSYIKKRDKSNECTITLCCDNIDRAYKDDNIEKLVDCLLALLLSSTVDIDRADYVVRDSIHAGVPTGIIDLERLLDNLVVAIIDANIEEEQDCPWGIKLVIAPAVLDKAISAVENLLLARVYMYNDVYLHSIVLSFDSLLQHFMSLLFRTTVSAVDENMRNDWCNSVSMFDRFMCCVDKLIHLIGEYSDKHYSIPNEKVEEFLEIEDCGSILVDATIEHFLTIYSNKHLTTKLLRSTPWLRDVYAKNPALLAATIFTAQSLRSHRHWDIIVVAGERVGEVYARMKEVKPSTFVRE